MAITIDGTTVTFGADSSTYTTRTPTYHNFVSISGTSGATITGIPSNARRVWVEFWNVGTSGTDSPMLRWGTSSGVATTGYYGSCTNFSTTGTAGAVQTNTAGALLVPSGGNTTSYRWWGTIELNRLGSYLSWNCTWTIGSVATTFRTSLGTSTCPIGGNLERISVVPSGSNTFAQGEFAISYS